VFVVKKEVVDEFLADPVWEERLRRAGSVVDVERLFVEFCKAKGLKVVRV